MVCVVLLFLLLLNCFVIFVIFVIFGTYMMGRSKHMYIEWKELIAGIHKVIKNDDDENTV